MGGTRGLSWTGLILETWNVEWILMDRGSRRRTASGLMMRAMGKGPTNLGASLWFSTFFFLMKWTILLKRSTTVRMAVWPLDVGRAVTKSREM